MAERFLYVATGGKYIQEAKKLSTYLNDLETVDLVKMDVEGAELHIIKDLVETATIGRVKNYHIEYHHNLNTDKSNLSSFLKPFEDNRFLIRLEVASEIKEVNASRMFIPYF